MVGLGWFVSPPRWWELCRCCHFEFPWSNLIDLFDYVAGYARCLLSGKPVHKSIKDTCRADIGPRWWPLRTARAPQPPTNRAPNEPTRPMWPRKHILGQNGFWANHPNYFVREQKFWYTHIRKPLRHLIRIVLLVGHGAKWIKWANIRPKMTKNAYFWPNLAVIGPKTMNI